jgi:hypothetical protein
MINAAELKLLQQALENGHLPEVSLDEARAPRVGAGNNDDAQ